MRIPSPLLGALVPLVLVAACGTDDPAPRFEPATTASSGIPTASAKASPSPESPTQVVSDWVRESYVMQNSNDSSAFLQASKSSCRPCVQLAKLVHSYYAAGGFINAGAPLVRQPREVSRNGPAAREYLVTVVAKPTSFKRSSNQPQERTAGGSVTLDIFVVRDDGHWRITEYFNRKPL